MCNVQVIDKQNRPESVALDWTHVTVSENRIVKRVMRSTVCRKRLRVHVYLNKINDVNCEGSLGAAHQCAESGCEGINVDTAPS